MNELGNILQKGWQNAGDTPTPPWETEKLIAEAKRLNGESLKFQRSTVLILGSTFLMMCYFLLFYFKFQMPLSHIGVGIMLGFFLLRVVLEAYSIQKGREKSSLDAAAASLEKEKQYLSLRLRIHSTFTYLTLGAYTLGFLLLLPEFALHISTGWMIAFVASYFVPGTILTLLIRKNVQKELQELRTVVEIREKIMK
jgi:Ca2+/Na+ antiporter